MLVAQRVERTHGGVRLVQRKVDLHADLHLGTGRRGRGDGGEEVADLLVVGVGLLAVVHLVVAGSAGHILCFLVRADGDVLTGQRDLVDVGIVAVVAVADDEGAGADGGCRATAGRQAERQQGCTTDDGGDFHDLVHGVLSLEGEGLVQAERVLLQYFEVTEALAEPAVGLAACEVSDLVGKFRCRPCGLHQELLAIVAEIARILADFHAFVENAKDALQVGIELARVRPLSQPLVVVVDVSCDLPQRASCEGQLVVEVNQMTNARTQPRRDASDVHTLVFREPHRPPDCDCNSDDRPNNESNDHRRPRKSICTSRCGRIRQGIGGLPTVNVLDERPQYLCRIGGNGFGTSHECVDGERRDVIGVGVALISNNDPDDHMVVRLGVSITELFHELLGVSDRCRALVCECDDDDAIIGRQTVTELGFAG